MKRNLITILFAALTPMAVLCEPVGAQVRVDWTVETSIGVAYFSDADLSSYTWPSPRNASADRQSYQPRFVIRSPDGRYFYVLIHRGVLVRDSNVYELLVYRTQDVRRATNAETQIPPLFRIVRETRSSRMGAIDDVEWQSDSRFLHFMASVRPEDDRRELHELDMSTGEVRQLTHINGMGVQSNTSVRMVAARDGGVLFNITRSDPNDLTAAYPSVALDRRQDGGLRIPPPFVNIRSNSYAGSQGQLAYEGDGEFLNGQVLTGGRRAVAVLRSGNSFRFLELDLTSRRTHELGRAVGPDARVISVPQSGEILLVGLVSGSTPRIVEYEPGRSRIIDVGASPQGAEVTSFSPEGFVLRDGASSVIYRKRGGSWVRIANSTVAPSAGVEPRQSSRLTIEVRQGANDRPVLIASEGRHHTILLDPNPQLESARWSPVQPFSWPEAAGEVEGLLIRPAGTTGVLPPLIVQIQNNADPRIFLPDGFQSAGYAAQAFAAQGYTVLIVPSVEATATAEEGPNIVRRIDAAVTAIGNAGLADPTCVGLMGFSRNGYQAHYVVSHPGRTPIMAFAAFDSATADYGAGLHSVVWPQSPPGNQPYRANRVETFYSDRSAWLENEITFNADRVRTALLFTFHERSSPTSSSEYYGHILGAYNANRVPSEFVFFPQSSHSLIRPLERQSEMQLTIDWMNFWLRDLEPADQQRAERWRALRPLYREMMARPQRQTHWIQVPN